MVLQNKCHHSQHSVREQVLRLAVCEQNSSLSDTNIVNEEYDGTGVKSVENEGDVAFVESIHVLSGVLVEVTHQIRHRQFPLIASTVNFIVELDFKQNVPPDDERGHVYVD